MNTPRIVAAALLAAAFPLAQAGPPPKPLANMDSCAKPAWPREALRDEQQGVVTLAFLIGEDGSVRAAKVLKSSGFALLDLAALNGIERCTFTPGTHAGKPVAAWTQLQYAWTLEESAPEDGGALRAAAQRGKAEDQFRFGLHLAYSASPKDAPAGAAWVRKAAQQGHAKAQEALGQLHLKGYGVDKHPAEALAWLGKAAAQGLPSAQRMLATLERDPAAARSWLRQSAQGGDAAAQGWLGAALLRDGDMRGLDWLNKAAAQRDRDALATLGALFASGKGVAQDQVRAAAYYKEAAAMGSKPAQLALARMYDSGTGVGADPERARMLRAAAAQ